MDQLTQLRTEFEAAIQALRNENQFIKNQLDQFTQSTKSTRPKPSLPEPEKFSGQSLKFDTWLPAIKAKLRIDGAAIGDASAQFYYVYLNLDSSVQAMVLPQLNYAEENADWNYQVILDQLTRVYDNPNKIQEAEDRLLSLKQGDDNLTTYVAKFERILYEARSQTWPDAVKISAFRRGLGTTIKNRLIQQLNLPTDYPSFLRVVQQLAGHSNQSQPHSQPTASNLRSVSLILWTLLLSVLWKLLPMTTDLKIAVSAAAPVNIGSRIVQKALQEVYRYQPCPSPHLTRSFGTMRC